MTAASDVRFRFIMPTVGRYSLTAAALSAMTQFEPGDSLTIVSDGPVDGVADKAAKLGVGFIEGPKTGHWGNEQRNLVLDQVCNLPSGATHLVFLDDDDRLVPRSLRRVRERVALEPDRLFLFRFLARYRLALWQVREVLQGNVGTGSIVAPIGPWLGRYGDRYEGDFDFIVETLARMKTPPVFSPLFLQCANPQPGDAEGLADLNERIVP